MQNSQQNDRAFIFYGVHVLDQVDEPSDKMNEANCKDDVMATLIDDHVREALTSNTDEDLNEKKRQMFAINKSYSVEVNYCYYRK